MEQPDEQAENLVVHLERDAKDQLYMGGNASPTEMLSMLAEAAAALVPAFRELESRLIISMRPKEPTIVTPSAAGKLVLPNGEIVH